MFLMQYYTNKKALKQHNTKFEANTPIQHKTKARKPQPPRAPFLFMFESKYIYVMYECMLRVCIKSVCGSTNVRLKIRSGSANVYQSVCESTNFKIRSDQFSRLSSSLSVLFSRSPSLLFVRVSVFVCSYICF